MTLSVFLDDLTLMPVYIPCYIKTVMTLGVFLDDLTLMPVYIPCYIKTVMTLGVFLDDLTLMPVCIPCITQFQFLVEVLNNLVFSIRPCLCVCQLFLH